MRLYHHHHPHALQCSPGRHVLDSQLDGKKWVTADTLTLADFALSTPLAFAVPAELPLGDFRNVQRWSRPVQGLDAWKETGK
jgi:glutathione S-transferase